MPCPSWYFCNHCDKDKNEGCPCPFCPHIYWMMWMRQQQTQAAFDAIERANQEARRQAEKLNKTS